MGMFNKVDVTGGVGDFWDYIRAPRPHRWAIWGVAIALTWVIFHGVSEYLIPYEKPKPSIVYFENWKSTRSEAEIRADWIARASETTRQNAKTRAEYQRLADSLGVEYDSSEADKLTREALGAEDTAAAMEKPAPVQTRSTLAERAARGQSSAPATSPKP